MASSSQTSVEVPHTPNGKRLQGKLGVVAIAFMVIACASPLTTIAGGAPQSVAFGNGLGTPANYAVVSIFMLFFAVALSTMNKYVSNAGAFYVYVGRGLGAASGLAAAFISWAMYTTIQVGVYSFFGLQLQDSIARLGGPNIPWWAYTLLMILVVGFLGYRRIELGAKVIGIALIGEILVVLVIDLAILIQGGDHGLNLSGFNPAVFAGDIPLFAVGVMLCASGYIGFEATAVFRDEAVNPERTIPRATYLSVIVIGLLYAGSTWIMTLGWGDNMKEVAATGSPFVLDLATRFVGPILADITNVLLITSLFATVLALHNIISRYQFSLASSQVLPAPLGKVHPSHGSPHISSVAQTATAFALVTIAAALQLDPNAEVFTWANGIGTFGFLIALCMTCLSILVFFLRHKHLEHGVWKTKVAPVLAFIGLFTFLVLSIIFVPYLTAGNAVLGYTLLSIIVAVGIAGAAVALYLKKTKSPRYEGIVKLTQE
jgi:amino acid transporter